MMSHSQRGQALVIIVFSIIGLVAITGLAVDGGLAFSDRRNAQNAADNAAVAGAMARIKALSGSSPATIADANAIAINEALNMAGDNGYTGDLVSSQVEVYTCDDAASSCGSYYAGNPDYLQVIITSYLNTAFARVIGITQMTNKVQAVAVAKPPYSGSIAGGAAIVELKPHGRTNCSNGNGEFIVGGSGTVSVNGGGVLVNSDSPCAFQQNGCQTTLIADASGGINLVGGASLQASCTTMMPDSSFFHYGATPIAWPPVDYIIGTEPPECNQVPAAYSYDGVNTTTLYPGYYDKLPPVGLPGQVVQLAPGNYCVGSVVKQTSSATTLQGTGVFIYVKPGGYFGLNGGNVDLTADIDPAHLYTNPYWGYLFYVAPQSGYVDFSSNPPACTINGGAVSNLTGAILAPYCDITVSGSSGSTGIHSQIIGYTITLSGNNELDFYYDASQNPVQNIKAEVGLVH